MGAGVVYHDIHLIVNPVSGRSRIGLRLRQIARRARRNGARLTIHETLFAGHATRMARELGAGGGLIVAVGGDGTVREVVAGLVGQPSPLAVIPAGTENLFAREFGYRNDVEAFWSLVEGGERFPIDVGRCNERLFLSIIGVGFDGLAVEHLHRVRRGHISHLHYFWPLWRSFWEYTFPAIRVHVDGADFFAGPGLAFVGNLPRYAIGLRVCQMARCDDGLLDVCVYPCSWRGKLLVHSWRTLLSRHLSAGDALYRQCRHVRVESDEPVPVQCDGDLAGPLPVEASLVDAPVTLLLSPRMVPLDGHGGVARPRGRTIRPVASAPGASVNRSTLFLTRRHVATIRLIARAARAASQGFLGCRDGQIPRHRSAALLQRSAARRAHRRRLPAGRYLRPLPAGGRTPGALHLRQRR